jgi:methyl-accepting chemotaxis protein
VTQVNMGTQTVQQASDTILTLVKEVAQINGLLSEVAVAAREQSQGVAAVGQAVHEIDSITHQNARLADNTRDAAAALEAQSLELAENFHRFKVSSV